MPELSLYTTMSLPEATFYEIFTEKPSRIGIPHQKAVFVFDIDSNLLAARKAFNDETTEINLREFLTRMTNLKKRMYSTLMEKGNE